MPLWEIKVLVAFAILLAALIGGALPILVARHAGSRRFFSLGNAFAGGLFLGIGFIHLLPEGIEKLEGIVEFPLAVLLSALGFSLLLLIDRVIFEDQREGGGSDSRRTQSFQPYLLLGLLSIHSVIAGVALGLETQASAWVILTLGILLHKSSAAFALIVTTYAAGLEGARQKVLLTILVAMTPLGLVIGLITFGALEGTNTILITGSFNALAAGTFIYVAILHIIDEELSKRDIRVAQYTLSVVSGSDDVPMPTKDVDRIAKFVLIIAGMILITFVTHFVG